MLKLQTASKDGLPAMRASAALSERSASDWHPWLHAWAIITIVVGINAVIFGSLVTSLRVGMVDPDWPTSPWHLLTTQWSDKSFGYLVEHGHRFVDYLTGICAIGLAVGTWLVERRTWVRWLGPAALAAVIVQGILGGLRVKLNDHIGTELRIVHGCMAHLFIAFLGAIVLVTSRGWSLSLVSTQSSKRLRVVAVMLVVALYLQVIFGAILRHTDYAPLAQRGHLLFAMVAVAAATWLVVLSRLGGQGRSTLLYALQGLMLLQVLLGVETWLKRFRNGPFVDLQPAMADYYPELALRTLHMLVGAMLFTTAVMIAVGLYRSSIEVKRTMEGMA